MKTTLVAVTLLGLLVIACGKDDDIPVAGVTPEATPGFETPAPLAAGPPTIPTDTRLEIESVSGTVGRKATAAITMQEATEGLAGFKLEVSVKDPNIARIVGVDLSNFDLVDTSPLPANVLSITAVDLNRVFEGPFDRETLATLDLELLAAGETEIVLRVLTLDDDRGDAVSAKAVHGRLTVSD